MTLNWGPCAKRIDRRERVETSEATDDELARAFDFMEFAGRLGGHAIVLHHLSSFASRWIPGIPITVLDMRCGRGDLSRAIVRWARRRSVDVHILAVDRYGRVVHMARQESEGYPEITFEVRDRSDPMFLQAQQFDYVVSDLALHHEGWSGAVALLKTANLLAKRGIIFGDWLRDLRGLACLGALARLGGNPVAAEEASVWVKRGFTRAEVAALAKEAAVDYAPIREFLGIRFSLAGERGLALGPEFQRVTGLAGT